ncbi:methylaspartate mutase [Amycolatopsis mediterranei]|uniref:methylaspartate mutase n=1 Tax=Amycolatopsis mediterranei TaxID=33910 RepID=UPI003445BC9B
MTGFGAFVAAAARRGELVVQPRMGFGDVARMRAGLVATRDAGVPAAGTITLDSFTRTGDHGSVRAALAEGRQLNGYPIVDHPLEVTREMLAGLCGPDFPVQVRHGSPRPQRIMAALVAAGLDATEGGPISYCLPYSRVPVAESVRAWTEAVRVFAGQREHGRPHLETFGGCMMGQLCPPALLVAISLLEAMFFRGLGLDSVSLSYAQQTHPGQDLEALLALRALAGEFLPATEWHIVVYAYMGSFPRTPGGALALVADAARLCVRGGAERLIVKTTAEAHRIPTIAENVTALRVASATAGVEDGRAAVVEDTGIAAQARAVVEAVLDLETDLGAGLARAVRIGLLDVPYCLHPDNARRTGATVDAAGRLRWTRTGDLPLRGLADAGGEPGTAEQLLRALSYMERKYDDAALNASGDGREQPLAAATTSAVRRTGQ